MSLSASEQIAQHPERAGRLVVRPRALGIVLAVAGLLLMAWGVWLGVRGAVVLGAMLLVAWLLDVVGLLMGDPWRNVWVMRQITPQPAQAGQVVDVWLMTASSNRRAATWLTGRFEDFAPWHEGWVRVREVVDVATASMAGGGHGVYRLTPPWRGEVAFGPLRLLADSPLGLWQSRRTDKRTTGLMVWPATAPVAVPPMAAQDSQSATGMGLPKPHLDDTTLREYQPGDDLHRVHWPSLARTNTLMTRAEEPSAIRRTVGALWVLPGAEPDAVDLGVGLLASWGEAMLASGQQFELWLGENLMRQPGRTQLMEALAVVEKADVADVAAGSSPTGRRAGADSAIVVAVAGASDASVVVPALAGGGVGAVIVPDEVDATVPAGWDVVRIQPSARLEDAALALQQGLAGHGSSERTSVRQGVTR